MLLHRDYKKSKAIQKQEWRDFEHHTAWWETEIPLAPLPPELQTLLDQDNPQFVNKLLAFALYCESSSQWNGKHYTWVDNMDILERERSWLWSLYLNEKPLARKGFLKLFESIPSQEFQQFKNKLKINFHYFNNGWQYVNGFYFFNIINKHYFRYLKAIYKLAEKKQDIPVWAMLTYRFEVERDFYHQHINGKSYYPAKYSLTPKTRSYLARRSWRTLRTLGNNHSADYVHMATELLLHYSAKDARTISITIPETNQTTSVPSYTRLWVLNHILYHHSNRFTYGSSTWKANPGAYTDEPPEVREEAFPKLWDQHPKELLRLLLEAKLPPIIHFAGRALRLGNPTFVASLSDKMLKNLLQSKQAFHRDFAIREFLNRLDKNKPDVNQFFSFFTSKYPDIRKRAVEFLHLHHHNWEKQTKVQLIQMCLEKMEKSYQAEILEDWLGVFKTDFQDVLPEVVKLSSLTPLLTNSHPSIERWLVLLLSCVQIEQYPYTAMELLPFLQNESESIRQAARHLLHQHYTQLQCTPEFLVELISIPYEENQVFVTQFIADRMLWMVPFLPQLIDQLWSRMVHEDCPEIVRHYIQNDLFGTLFLSEITETPLEKVLALLEHNDTGLQELGARILSAKQLDPEVLTFDQLLQLSHSQIALARKEARNLMIRVIHRVTEDWLVNLVETDWDDTRNWAFAYMRTLSVDQFTPKLIYGLLDSSREDVQAFAMQLVEIHFHDLDISELLLRASESTDLFVQEYALSLAEKITWDVTKVEKLQLFFRTILFRVHQARNAKEMALSLLIRLGEMNQSMARVIVPILADVAHTSGKRDFERILLTLTRIQAKYPEIETPIQLK